MLYRVGNSYARRATQRDPVPDSGVTTFLASTDREARDGDIIDQASWVLDDYRANPVVLDSHWGQVVGRAKDVRLEDDGLVVDVEWDEAECNPAGRLLAHQHRNGFRRAVSVRWIPGRTVGRSTLPKSDKRYREKRVVKGTGYQYEVESHVHFDCRLLEVSSVAVPSDPAALQRGYDEDSIRELIRAELAALSAPTAPKPQGPRTIADLLGARK